MKKSEVKDGKLKKRTPQEKEADLARIVELSLQEPLLANNTYAFSKFVAKVLNISISQARRDVEEVEVIMKALADIDYKKIISRKLLEYAHIKELALKENNLNAYLGAVKGEAELLGLKRFSLFTKEDDNGEQLKELEEKKREFLKNILNE